MTDEKEIARYNAEIVEHANGAAQYLDALAYGKFATREQAREMADYVLAETKKNIESCPHASQEEKKAEIQRRENLVKLLKLQTGL